MDIKELKKRAGITEQGVDPRDFRPVDSREFFVHLTSMGKVEGAPSGKAMWFYQEGIKQQGALAAYIPNAPNGPFFVRDVG